jgi:uncharacterized protein (DUF1684 family)
MRWRLALLTLLLAGAARAQDERVWQDSLQAYWDRIETEYRDSIHSPLPKQYRAGFKNLDRYPPDPRYRVMARFTPEVGEAFPMKTSGTRTPAYRSIGVLTFRLGGKEQHLTVYQNIDLVKRTEYVNHLFVPFTDLTNGEATYGGGRYLDLEGPLGAEVELDLNRAYNPYCAYGGAYSCPIPPLENHLEVAVEAGVKAFPH